MPERKGTYTLAEERSVGKDSTPRKTRDSQSMPKEYTRTYPRLTLRKEVELSGTRRTKGGNSERGCQSIGFIRVRAAVVHEGSCDPSPGSVWHPTSTPTLSSRGREEGEACFSAQRHAKVCTSPTGRRRHDEAVARFSRSWKMFLQLRHPLDRVVRSGPRIVVRPARVLDPLKILCRSRNRTAGRVK